MQTGSSVTVTAPPSKSLSHRALIAAALAAGQSRIENVLESEDLERTRDCLAVAGARFERQRGGYLVQGVSGAPAGGTREAVLIDVGESGTTCRLLTAVLAAGRGMFLIQGKGRMHERPIGELTRALEGLGVTVRHLDKAGCPPLTLIASGLPGGRASISMDESSQYLSGLLLASPLAASESLLEIGGSKAVSWPYVALTLDVLRDFGVDFSVERRSGATWSAIDFREPADVAPGAVRFRVRPGAYAARTYRVEGDWSNASYLLAAGALGRRPVTVAGLKQTSLQGDRAIVDILRAMGARVEFFREGGAVTVYPATLHGVDVDMGHCPDLVPTVAVLASRASSVTRITGVAHLRIKESDRLAAMAGEIAKTGAAAEVLPDGLRVQAAAKPVSGPVAFATYGDHRVAMSLSLYELAGIRPAFDNPACVAKSFPGFWERWREIVAA
ncbi:MAG: 3-phosphoshikimate 1-carboxyvinyltransferase [Desulfovibrionaceae bacterium]|nr:3-phosphoshikimate 1-carboxyvinyltransferase [Desulfovibrionaceae bacterium]MBF0514241.1 3-phosphoshikimate 1-carboxyvinyltransferase [Desulfovibrionaceae bacterium]